MMLKRQQLDDDDLALDCAPDDFQGERLGVVGRILDFLLFVLHFLWTSVWAFLRDWGTSRPLLTLLRGLPFMLLFLAVACVFLASGRISHSDLVARYRNAAAEAYRQQNEKAAILWLEKAAQLEPNEPTYPFRRALLVDEEGRRDRARHIMRRIAPQNGEGYPEAHFWLARDMVDQSPSLSPELSRTIEHHLKQALRSSTLESEAHALLGQLMVIRRDVPQAIAHFEAAVETNPECHLALAVLYGKGQDPAKVVPSARRAAAYFRKRAEAESTTSEHHLRWAQAELLAGNFTESVAILERALGNTNNPEPFHELLVAAHLGWLGEVMEKEPYRLDKQLDILNDAFEHGPDNAEVLSLIASLATQRQDGADSQGSADLREALTSSLARGLAPPLVHLILGTRALETSDFETAAKHLELAWEANPKMVDVLNNLAWALLHEEPPDLERALKLIDSALPLSNHPNLRGTHATILAAMGRSNEAITELESVLRHHPDPAWVHEQLAALYAENGLEDLAEQHARMAARVRKMAKE